MGLFLFILFLAEVDLNQIKVLVTDIILQIALIGIVFFYLLNTQVINIEQTIIYTLLLIFLELESSHESQC